MFCSYPTQTQTSPRRTTGRVRQLVGAFCFLSGNAGVFACLSRVRLRIAWRRCAAASGSRLNLASSWPAPGCCVRRRTSLALVPYHVGVLHGSCFEAGPVRAGRLDACRQGASAGVYRSQLTRCLAIVVIAIARLAVAADHFGRDVASRDRWLLNRWLLMHLRLIVSALRGRCCGNVRLRSKLHQKARDPIEPRKEPVTGSASS